MGHPDKSKGSTVLLNFRDLFEGLGLKHKVNKGQSMILLDSDSISFRWARLKKHQQTYKEYEKRRISTWVHRISKEKIQKISSTCDNSIHFCKEHILNHPPNSKASLIFRPHLISRQGSGDCLGVSIGTPNPRHKKLKNSYLWLRYVNWTSIQSQYNFGHCIMVLWCIHYIQWYDLTS